MPACVPPSGNRQPGQAGHDDASRTVDGEVLGIAEQAKRGHDDSGQQDGPGYGETEAPDGRPCPRRPGSSVRLDQQAGGADLYANDPGQDQRGKH